MMGHHRYRHTPVLSLSLAAILAVSALGSGQAAAQFIIDAAAADRVPEGLSTSDWSSIRAAYEARRHTAFAVDGGYQARNPGQQWRTRFDGRGFLTTPDAGGWSWGLDLVSYGRAGAEQSVTAPSCVEADGGRVCYQWDEALTEWYVNDGRGLEHGYTVHRRPVAEDVARASRPWVPRGEQSHDRLDQSRARKEAVGSQLQRPAPLRTNRSLTVAALNDAHARRDHKLTGGSPVLQLQFTLAVRGGLIPRVSDDGRNVTFIGAGGAAVVNYHGLTVYDAGGVALPAWFEEAGEALVLSVDDRGARYPLTVDPIAQQAYLKASNTGFFDIFGGSVAASGDTVVVGAELEDSSATGVDGNQADNSANHAGAAYVFVKGAGGVWSQQAYLKASNTNSSDRFGVSVAVSGDTVVVGAYAEDSSATGVDGNQADNSSNGAGAAYIFVRGAGGAWSQQAYLKASNTDEQDWFGWSVGASGNTVVVGAILEDSSATGVDGNQGNFGAFFEAGAAYVFVRGAGGVWSQQGYLKASNTDAGDRFGQSVGVSGDTVVVGAWQEDSSATGVDGNQADNSASLAGAAYVFVRDAGGVWSQQGYLKASNTDAEDRFGRSVAVSGDTVVVGATGEDSSATGVDGNQADNSAVNAGAAYVFVRGAGGFWSQQAYLKASNTDSRDGFGWSVAASGDTVVVGASGEGSSATGVNGNQADNSAFNAGAVYVFPPPDCNANGIPDATDIADGTSPDCNANGIPDECETDCNTNGIPDDCDVDPLDPDGNGQVSPDCGGDGVPDECDPDCNANGIPDDCDVDPLDPDGNGQVSLDCNANGIPDECETDCNANGIPDDCDLDPLDPDGNGQVSPDCNANGIPDECDVDPVDPDGDGLVSLDCNANGIPDECETDCNANGIHDDCDVDPLDPDGNGQVSVDCNANGIPDECETDCNANGIPDDCDLDPLDPDGNGQVSVDCNANGIPDECDTDCNANGIHDDCDVDPVDPDGNGQVSADCNANGIPDECDIDPADPDGSGQISADCQPDAIPDECQTRVFIYSMDDGTGESFAGLSTGGSVAWMNHFTVNLGSESIGRLRLAWGPVANGTSATVYLWSDPNGDGNPSDAQVLASAPTTVQDSGTNLFTDVAIPNTLVGSLGTSFFAGVIIAHQAGEQPTVLDTATLAGQTWLVADGTSSIDPNNLGASAFPPFVTSIGVALVRAVPLGNDCNNNGIPDDCEGSEDVAIFIGEVIAAAPNPFLTCLFDVNVDGKVDGLDIQPFVDRLLGP